MPHIARERYAVWAVAGLAAFRAAVPLAALAASGHKLPALPRYEYVGFTGDATGFYAATREFIASWGRLPVALVGFLAVATMGFLVVFARMWKARPRLRAWLVVAAAAWVSLATCVGVAKMHAPGAAVFGWPFVWSLPLFPLRALGRLDVDVAFAFGLVLSLVANVLTVVATAFAGFYASGRRAIGVAAAALVAFWPLLTGAVDGSRAWENGTWNVDVGLAMYTEPVSTALVTVALALLLSPRLDSLRLAIAGSSLGLASVVKVSNGLLAAGALVLLVARFGSRRPLPFAAAALAFLPLVVVYWPKGYPAVDRAQRLAHPQRFSLDYARANWADSLLFTPQLLLLLVPLAVLGALVVREWPRRLLVLAALVNPLFYTFYFDTRHHPRFLFASLPPAFVLWVVGATWLYATLRARLSSADASKPA